MPWLTKMSYHRKKRSIAMIATLVTLTMYNSSWRESSSDVAVRKRFGMAVQSWNKEEKTIANSIPPLFLIFANTTRSEMNAPAVSIINNNVDAPLRIDNNGNDTVVCFTMECFQQLGQRLARAYSHQHKQSWCIPTSKRGNKSRVKAGPGGHKWQGLLLTKTPKAASSTTAGVVLRIHARHGCAIQWQHVPGKYYFHGRVGEHGHNASSSLLIATVRNPSARALSHAWYGTFDRYDRTRLNPTDENIIKVIQSKGNNGSMMVCAY
jgi:hypothetical protein